MDDEQFWALIALLEWKDEGDDDKAVAPVVGALKKKPIKDIKRFAETLAFKLYCLDSREHAEGCCGDDGFLYSRCVVVANGKEYYENVLQIPTDMPAELEFEALLYVAQTAYEMKTGKDFDYETGCSFETGSNLEGWK